MKALSLLICVVSLPSLTTSTNRTLRFSSQPQFTLHKWRKLKPKRCSSSKNSLRKWQNLMPKDQDHKTELLLLLKESTKMMVQTPQMDQKLPALLPSSSFSLPSNSLRIRWTITTPSTTLSTVLEEHQDLREEKNQENTMSHLQLLLLLFMESLRPKSSWRTRLKHKTKPKLE